MVQEQKGQKSKKNPLMELTSGTGSISDESFGSNAWWCYPWRHRFKYIQHMMKWGIEDRWHARSHNPAFWHKTYTSWDVIISTGGRPSAYKSCIFLVNLLAVALPSAIWVCRLAIAVQLDFLSRFVGHLSEIHLMDVMNQRTRYVDESVCRWEVRVSGNISYKFVMSLSAGLCCGDGAVQSHHGCARCF